MHHLHLFVSSLEGPDTDRVWPEALQPLQSTALCITVDMYAQKRSPNLGALG